jgi:hypothetical protein
LFAFQCFISFNNKKEGSNAEVADGAQVAPNDAREVGSAA